MAIVDKPWDGSASRWDSAAEYCKCCAINGNTGDSKDWTKDACKLPYCEPNGDINKNALSAASAALAGARGGIVGVSSSDRKSAARKLLSAYREAKMPPPDSLEAMAQ